MKENLYKVLGIDKIASKTEIKKGYRKKAKEYHPDRNPDDKEAEDMFKKVSYAYEILSDDNKRARYDNGGHNALEGGTNHTHNNMQDMFREMARQQAVQQEKMQHGIKVSTKITLEEVHTGVTKNFKYNRQIKCTPCNGLGGTEPSICLGCQGSGRKIKVTSTQFGHMQEIGKCHDCNGKGTKFKNNCDKCKGVGHITSREEVSIVIPHGIENGMTFHQADGGHEMVNGGFGDLVIQVFVSEHPIYKLGYGDFGLTSELKVPYEILMLGGNTKFKTIDGSTVSLTIKKLSKAGTKLKLAGKGLMKPNFNHVRGDQYLILNVDFQGSITPEEEKLLQKLKKLKE